MSSVAWFCGPYVVTSWGNGLAYTVAAPDGRTAFLQGDDAAAWRAEYDAADDTEAGAAPFIGETLANYASPAE